MDTKWKNRLIVLLFVVLLTFGMKGIMTALKYGSNFTTVNYFHSQSFAWELEQFIDYLSMFELQGLNKKQLIEQIKVTDDEIEEHRYRYGSLTDQVTSIRNQYEARIAEAEQNNEAAVMNFYIEERDQKIEDITNNFKSDEHVRAKIKKEKEKNLEQYFHELEEMRSEFGRYEAAFTYYLRDTDSGQVFTNVATESPEGITKTNDLIFFRQYPSQTSGYLVARQSHIYSIDSDLLVSTSSNEAKVFEGQIAVSKSTPSASFIVDNYFDYKKRQLLFISYVLISVLTLVSCFFLYRIYRKVKVVEAIYYEQIKSHYNRLPIDVRLVAFMITSIICLSMLTGGGHYYLYGNLLMITKELVYNTLVSALVVGVTLLQVILLIDQARNWNDLKTEIKNSTTNRLFNSFKDVFLYRSIGMQQLIILGISFCFGAGLIISMVEQGFLFIYLIGIVIVGIPSFFFVVRRTGYLNKILINTNDIAQGHFVADIPVRGKSPLAIHASHINALKHGVKSSQKEQAKSERLKTELITNVSHDLRTPLTSIITYAELLKTPNLEEEERASYVEIIDRKSKRLKILIDDLFEASKMASGNMELTKGKVDLVQLLHQSLAEHNETMDKSSLQFRIKIPQTPVYAYVDGQKFWRVFDNLIRNIFNYSLENTRVYVTLDVSATTVEISFKNITKYELGGNIEEMFERFKRGDLSRHTEGSGLGLAIAKSIVDLHEGSLDIEVDGDLFKATVVVEKIGV